MRFRPPVFQLSPMTSEGQSKASENSIKPSPQPSGESRARVIWPNIEDTEGVQVLPPSRVLTTMPSWGQADRFEAASGSTQSGSAISLRRGGRLHPPIRPSFLLTNSIQA